MAYSQDETWGEVPCLPELRMGIDYDAAAQEGCRIPSEFVDRGGWGDRGVAGESSADIVNHPPHYTFGTIEVLDAIEDWELGYHGGNVVKYLARAPHKGSELEDLKKAQFYLNRYIAMKERE